MSIDTEFAVTRNTGPAQASFVHGASSVPLRFETIGQALDAAAARWGEREALVVAHQGIRLSYTALRHHANSLAAALISIGLEPGDRIGIWAPNCAEWAITQFATAKAGLILVNINPAYRLPELEFALKKVGCRALVTAPKFKGSDYLEMISALAPETATSAPGELRAARLPELKWLIRLGTERTPGFLSFSDLVNRDLAEQERCLASLEGRLQPDDPVNIQFTSGTTGSPKGATLTHFNVVNNSYFVGQAMNLCERDRVCIPVPLYHCFGMVMGNLGCVTHGAAMIYPNDGFDPRLTLESIANERCTVLYGVPTMFLAELEHPDFDAFDLSSLRTGIMAGAPCPVEVMRRVMVQMHLREITIAYGMTETSPVSFQSGVDDSLDRRVSTVGRVHPHLQVKVIDTEGRTVPVGVAGELLTRGYSVMRGYWNDPEQTAQAIDEAGWMHTGDLAALDELGYCKIVGRLKDLIIRGGENIYPREIEEFLYQHPKVLDVAVVGVSDYKYGEQVCAVIRLREGVVAQAEEIVEFCRGRIAHFKVPTHVRFVDSFPLTVTGKLQKFKIREQIELELGVEKGRTA